MRFYFQNSKLETRRPALRPALSPKGGEIAAVWNPGRGSDGTQARFRGALAAGTAGSEQARSAVSTVDLYPSIVLLAWSLARSDEIDLRAIAVCVNRLPANCSDLSFVSSAISAGNEVNRLFDRGFLSAF